MVFFSCKLRKYGRNGKIVTDINKVDLNIKLAQLKKSKKVNEINKELQKLENSDVAIDIDTPVNI